MKAHLSNLLLLIVATFSLSILTGCEILKQAGFAPPKIENTQVTIQSISKTGLSLTVLLDVNNTNPVTIPVQSFAYAIQINQNKLIDSQIRLEKQLTAGRISQVAIPLQVEFNNVLNILNSFSLTGVSLNLDGKLRLAIPFAELMEIPISAQKNVSLKDIRW